MKRFFSILFLTSFFTAMFLLNSVFSQNKGVLLDFEPTAKGSAPRKPVARSDRRGVALDFEPSAPTYQVPQGSTSNQPQQIEEVPKGSIFLWKMESEVNTVYILGSIHLASSDLYPLDNRIEEAFKKSKVLVVEVDINSMDVTILQEKFMQRGVYSGGDILANHISTATYGRVKKKLEDFSIDIGQMSIFKPWFLALNLVTLQLLKLGFDPAKGIDQHFLLQAEDNKQILQFEDIDYQLKLFDELTDQEQELFLISTLTDIEILNREMNSILGAWKTGDVGQIEALLRRGLRDNPDLFLIYNMFFYERNKNMAFKIESFFGKEIDYFCIVGAGHLAGEDGIIQLLEDKGYTLEQF